MITRVAIVGAGTMGHGIAAMASMAGYTVALTDSSDASRAAAHSKVERVVTRAIESGKLPSPPFASRAFRPSSIWAPGRRLSTNEQRKADALARVHVTETLVEAVDSADLVIEAIPERLELKRALFAELDDAAPAAALLATNTSSLSVTEIATAVGSPERVIGLHFFNPVAVMKLVELVRGAATSVHAIESATIFAESLGKTTILVRDSPGFATSRLGVVLGLEAIRMLEQGVASADDIDRAMELGYNHPVGPLRLGDIVGLDVRLAIADHLHATLGSASYEAPALLRQMVADGKLGRKTGQGFFRWNPPQ